jgi:hypothetical protein
VTRKNLNAADPQAMPPGATIKLAFAAAIVAGLLILFAMLPRAIFAGYFTSANVLVYSLEAKWGPWEPIDVKNSDQNKKFSVPETARKLAGFSCFVHYLTVWNPRALADRIRKAEREENSSRIDLPFEGRWRGDLLTCEVGRDTGSRLRLSKQDCNSVSQMMRLTGFADEQSMVASMLASSRCRRFLSLEVDIVDGAARYLLDCAGSSVSFTKVVATPDTLSQFEPWIVSMSARKSYGLPVMVNIHDLPFSTLTEVDPMVLMVRDFGPAHAAIAAWTAVAAFVAVWLLRWRATAVRVGSGVVDQVKRVDGYLVGTSRQEPPSSPP